MRISISHGRNESREFARKLASWLCLLGYDPWLDIENGTVTLNGGSLFVDQLLVSTNGNEDCHVILRGGKEAIHSPA